MIPTWTILTPLGAIGLCLAARFWLRRRRDRAWAAGVASRIHDQRYLDWLDAEFEAMDAGERP